MCGIARTLSKFHTTVAMPTNVTPSKKLFEKSYALSLTDSHTPVIGPFVRKVIQLFDHMTYENSLGIWNGDVPADLHYPNEFGAWMDDLLGREIPGFDLAAFNKWLDQCDNTNIFTPPEFIPQAPPNPKPGMVAVDGDILYSSENAPTPPNSPVKERTKRSRARKPKDQRPSRLFEPHLGVPPRKLRHQRA